MNNRLNNKNNSAATASQSIWMISEGKLSDLDLSSICTGSVSGPVIEYEISELAQYLLNPNPITLEENVIGCKILYMKPRSGSIRRFIKKLFSKKPVSGRDDSYCEEVISTSKTGTPDFNDRRLNMHLLKIKETLKPYDPVHKKLSGLKTDTTENIIALCEDIGKNRHQLNLKGSIQDKINFVTNSLSKKVKVAFNRAYLLNGLFEMRGFDFTAFRRDKLYRLIKLNENKQTKYCVLNENYKLLYWIEDISLVNYMHLFEQSIKTDTQLREAMNLCMLGVAQPLKLFFSTQREKSYSEKYLPRVYREVLSSCKVAPTDVKSISNILNNYQSIVTFNYVPVSGVEKNKMYTNISVMHDVKALEPIKTTLPDVYTQIYKKASVSDAGKLYLLDSLRGYQNV
ncbi:MAG: hypothetical protein AMK71_10670 [Nitrospira bacterium SG8_35_4]|nr:MAG: hypothetical protein AMK71_10670 [Nitrospira bacterium SG8_35_4]